MKKERIIIGGLFILQLILWLGFLLHTSPRFPGSLTGGIFGILGALLMIVPPLLYSAVKRIAFLKEKITKRISLGTILNWHVYTSIIGSILAIIHTGHRFESNLGIALTAMMMLTVLSGFIGRYYLSYSSKELHEKNELLNLLATQYNLLVGDITKKPGGEIAYAASHNIVRREFNSWFGIESDSFGTNTPPSVRAMRLVESIADVEYAIKTHEFLKKRTAQWLQIHILTSCIFYLLLILHIWSGIYFGLRYVK